MLKIFKLLSIFLLFSVSCFSNEEVMLFTFPKSGTHFIKAIYFNLTGETIDHSHPHMYENKNLQEMLKSFEKKKIICCYRDPRDALISYVNWVDMLNNPEWVPSDWNHISMEEKLIRLIDGKWHSVMYTNVIVLTELISRLSSAPNAIVVKFEDFIGPYAGGDLDKQIAEVNKVVQFITGESLDKEGILSLVDCSWGQKGTFHNPQIGKWKHHFTNKVKQRFKNSKWNSALIELGYEKDSNW